MLRGQDIGDARLAPGRSDLALKRVGKYRLDTIIGRGAVGIVYKGHDEQIDRPLAIKTLRPEVLADMTAGGDVLQRFAAEVRSAGRCLHPNIVTVFDYVEQDGAPYIVMEYVPSGTLENVIKSGTLLPLRQVAEIMAQLLLALDHAHSKGVIHRDVKPSNILCHSATSIKVADFGVAHLDSLDLTKAGGVGPLGTPNYMAPERFLGRPADARSDLFSAGVVLFQLLTGAKPYTANDVHELMGKLMHRLPPSVVGFRPELSLRFDAVVQQALARNPEDRYQNAEQFIDALNSAIESSVADSAPPLDLTRYSGVPGKDQPSGTSSKNVLGQTMAETLKPETLDAIERSLARTLGPIARILVKRAAAQSIDVDQLLTALSAPIKSPLDASQFRMAAERTLLGDNGMVAVQLQSAVSSPELNALTQALLPMLGPVARPLVARVAKIAVGRDDFYQRLEQDLPKGIDQAKLTALRAKFEPRDRH